MAYLSDPTLVDFHSEVVTPNGRDSLVGHLLTIVI